MGIFLDKMPKWALPRSAARPSAYKNRYLAAFYRLSRQMLVWALSLDNGQDIVMSHNELLERLCAFRALCGKKGAILNSLKAESESL